MEQGVPAAVRFSILQSQWYYGRYLLYSEVIGRQASVVNVENQAGIVGGGVKHLEQVKKKLSIFTLQTEDRGPAQTTSS